MPTTSQKLVYFFERTEEAGERPPQVFGQTPGLAEVADPELICQGDSGTSHGTILMRALRPRDVVPPVDP